MNETNITVVGRLTADPEMRYTQGGLGVANFTVASNPRKYDKASGEYVDAETTFWRCSAWRNLGENIVASLVKGNSVILLGNVETRKYTNKEGEERTSTEITVNQLGPNLEWGTAPVTPVSRNKTQATNQAQAQQSWAPAAVDDTEAPF